MIDNEFIYKGRWLGSAGIARSFDQKNVKYRSE